MNVPSSLSKIKSITKERLSDHNYEELKFQSQDSLKQDKSRNKGQFRLENLMRVEEENAHKERILRILESKAFNVFIMIISIYSLFADDIKIIIFPPSSDVSFSIIAIFVLSFFLIEIILTVLINEQYICGLYFWVDIISTISLLFDIHWIYYSIQTNQSVIREFGRGGRLAARTIRLMRLTRTIKVFNNTKKVKNNQLQINHHESQAGKKIQELTSRKVVFLIMLLIIALVSFNIELFVDKVEKYKLSISIFQYIDNYDELSATFQTVVSEMSKGTTNLTYAKIYDFEYGMKNFSDGLREIEKDTLQFNCSQNLFNDSTKVNTSNQCIANFDLSDVVMFSSVMNIVKTLFIILVIGIAAYFFEKDTQEIVSEPIAKMTKKISDISNNPLEAMLNDEDEPSEAASNKILCCKKKRVNKALETKILENTISKIGALLAIGFGEAGSEIIATNMKGSDDGDINPLIAGKKVMAVYGFCDIRNFTDTTEELEGDVMIFVNRIGEIVHQIVNENCGSANKNIGDAFLLVWKFPEDVTSTKSPENLMFPIPAQFVNVNHASCPEDSKDNFTDTSNSKSQARKSAFITPAKKNFMLQHKNSDNNSNLNNISNPNSHSTALYPSSNTFTQKPYEKSFSNKPKTFLFKQSIDRVPTNFSKVSNNLINHDFTKSNIQGLVNNKSEVMLPPDIFLVNKLQVNQIVDMALISFAKIAINLHKSKVLDEYRNHPKLKARMPGFCVKMGFGLHIGWSIEGAIGSSFKIDASYLSPHVNMASKLEEGTKGYKVHMILSDDFVNYLSKEARQRTRIIDKLKGEGDLVYSLHTLDLDLENIKIETEDEVEEDKMVRYLKNRKDKKRKLQSIKENKDLGSWQQFEASEFFMKARVKYSKEFYDLYNEALKLFTEGKFKEAKRKFLEADDELTKRPKKLSESEQTGDKLIYEISDGPSKNFVQFIESKEMVPADWNGYKPKPKDD